jgi:hypothetical protein
LLKSRLTPAPIDSALAIPEEEPATDPAGAAPMETEEIPEAAAVAEETEETPLAFKPAAKLSILPRKLFVSPSPQAAPAKGSTVTQPQPFVPAAEPKAQPGSGSGIRPFPKANPPAPTAKPALAGTGPLAQGTQAKPSPLPPAKPFAKVPTATPVAAGPKGTQKITVPPPK